MAQTRFTCTLTTADEPACQTYARVTITDREGASARACPRHAVAALDGIASAHVRAEINAQMIEWEQAEPHSRPEHEAAEAHTRAWAELDALMREGKEPPPAAWAPGASGMASEYVLVRVADLDMLIDHHAADRPGAAAAGPGDLADVLVHRGHGRGHPRVVPAQPGQPLTHVRRWLGC